MTQSLIALVVILRKLMSKKEKRPLKGAVFATAVGDAYHDGYIDGLKEQASQIEEAEILLRWVYSTKHNERVDFIIDQEIEDYFEQKETKIK